ncbi:MAG: fumarate hydratase, partial [Thermoanaerobaculia bacterium]
MERRPTSAADAARGRAALHCIASILVRVGRCDRLEVEPVTSMTATAPLHEVSAQPALFQSILELIRRTSTQLPDDVVTAITAAREDEAEGSNADVALNVIGCNIGLARESSLPLCQDTGTIL